MNSWRNEIKIHCDKGLVFTRLVSWNEIGNRLKVIVPHSIAVEVIMIGYQIFRIANSRPWRLIFEVSHWSVDIGYVHPLHHSKVDTCAIPMDDRIVDNVTDVVEMNPRFEVVFLCPQDLTDDKLKENRPSCPANIAFLDVIYSSKTITSVVVGLVSPVVL